MGPVHFGTTAHVERRLGPPPVPISQSEMVPGSHLLDLLGSPYVPMGYTSVSPAISHQENSMVGHLGPFSLCVVVLIQIEALQTWGFPLRHSQHMSN